MILIIYEPIDLSTMDFIKFLKLNNYAHYALTLEDLVKQQVQILDRDANTCTWSLQDGIDLDFGKISAVYLRTFEFKKDFFLNYNPEDQEYVANEWRSYFMYRMANVKKCVNELSLELLSSTLLEAPFFFKRAYNNGFNIPKHFFSTAYKEIEEVFYKAEKEYIVMNSLRPITDFRVSRQINDNAIGLIEHIKGKIIFVHIVNSHIFSCSYEEKKKYKYELDEHEKTQCLSLAKEISLKVLQIILVEKSTSEKVLINLSPYPNWNLAYHDDIKNIHFCLAEFLFE